DSDIIFNDIIIPVELYLMDSETVMEGRKKFDRSNTRALPLLNPKGKFEGMIEERELEGKKAGIKMGALATRDLYLMSGSSIRDLIETYRKDGEEALAIVDKDFALLGLVYPENIKELIIKMSG
ncbi:MAG: CBS domain-containing protein, partial [Nitrososphaerota archaeon]|nr:CBS domain-containing protein [Nitrososphaerota archaeon]